MDAFQEFNATIKDLQRRVSALESYNQVQKIATSNGTTIVDGKGLVSTANFPSSSISGGGVNTASTSYVDAPGSTLSNIVLTRTTKVFFGAYAFGGNGNWVADGSSLQFQIYVDSLNTIDSSMLLKWYLQGITQNGSQVITGWNTGTSDDEVFLGFTFSLNAGTYTPKLRFKVNGTGTASLTFFNFYYFILGS